MRNFLVMLSISGLYLLAGLSLIFAVPAGPRKDFYLGFMGMAYCIALILGLICCILWDKNLAKYRKGTNNVSNDYRS